MMINADLLAVSYGVGAIVWHSCSYIPFCGAQHSYYNAIIHSQSGVIILILRKSGCQLLKYTDIEDQNS